MSVTFSKTGPQPQDGLNILEAKILNALNSGAGSGSAGVTAANYGGAAPSFTPTTAGAVAIDTSNGRIWWWYSSAWH